MPRLLFTMILLSLCLYIGITQPAETTESVMAVSMRRATKSAFAKQHAATTTTAMFVGLLTAQDTNEQCLTVDSDLLTETPELRLKACRNYANQRWIYHADPSPWQLELDPSYCLATVNSKPSAKNPLTVRPCTDSRTLTLLPNPTLTGSYLISGTTYVLAIRH